MFCKYCGNENPDHSRFCNSCGAPISSESQSPNPIRPITFQSEQKSANPSPETKPKSFFDNLFAKIKSFTQKSLCTIKSAFGHLKSNFASLPENKRKSIKLFGIVGTSFLALCVAILIILFSTCVFTHHYSEATCATPKSCRLCGATVGEALGHNYTEAGFLQETCTHQGYTLYNCQTCSGSYKDVISPHPHSPTDATCTTPGICQECSLELTPSTGHSIEKTVIDTAATCTSEGSQHGTCSVCQEVISEVIPMLEHKESDWKIVFDINSYSISAVRKKQCTSCKIELASENYEPSSSEIKSYLKKNCKKQSYKKVFRYPDDYMGALSKFKGEVVQVMNSGSDTILRVDVTKERYFWTDTIYVLYRDNKVNNANILEDDIIWLYGVMNGTKTYETIMGGTVTIPYMVCYYIEFA